LDPGTGVAATKNLVWDGGYLYPGTVLNLGAGSSFRFRDLYFDQNSSVGSQVDLTPASASLTDVSFESCYLPQASFNDLSGSTGTVNVRFVDCFFPELLYTPSLTNALINANSVVNTVLLHGGNYQNISSSLTYDPGQNFILAASKFVGFNPVGNAGWPGGQPSVPSSATALTNTFGADRLRESQRRRRQLYRSRRIYSPEHQHSLGKFYPSHSCAHRTNHNVALPLRRAGLDVAGRLT
jgi:hypothetical protein